MESILGCPKPPNFASTGASACWRSVVGLAVIYCSLPRTERWPPAWISRPGIWNWLVNGWADLATVVRGDGRNLPFPDASFDYVYSHGVLHHSDEPQQVVQEIFRVLRPGGRFNIHVYALISYFTLWTMLRQGWHWKLYIENSRDPVHIDLNTGRSLTEIVCAGPDHDYQAPVQTVGIYGTAVWLVSDRHRPEAVGRWLKITMQKGTQGSHE